jgi:hypothetical protein
MCGPIPRARGPVVLSVHHGPVDIARLERSPCGATGHQSSPRWRGEGGGDGAELTEAIFGRRGCEVVPAAERIGVQRWCSVWSKWRHGEAKQGAARVVLWCRDVIGVYYSLGEALDRRGSAGGGF